MQRQYSGDRTVLMGCSICPFAGEYPTEIRYCSDGLFRCNVFCTETETPLDYERKQAMSRQRHDPQEINFRVGPPPAGRE